MFVIAATGDSHTWGQGAAGAAESFYPAVQGGDLRWVSFCYGSYVNLIRNEINRITGSYAVENLRVGKLPCEFRSDAGLLRLLLHSDGPTSCADILLDGVNIRHLEMSCGGSPEQYINVTIRTERPCTLKLEGSGIIIRSEEYYGSHAVVNCGIGGCPTFRYRTEYAPSYVAPLKPDLILAEAHTINDWLYSPAPESYGANLTELLKVFQSIAPRTMLMTVSPIFGNQLNSAGAYYDDFAAAGLAAAGKLLSGADIIDAGAVMRERLKGLAPDEQYSLLFADPWHPNDLGHRIYADLALSALLPLL